MVPFGASDIKGLMSYAAARHFQSDAKQVGGRCSGLGRIFGNPSCADINAGSLHVVLANQIGLKKQGVVMDVDPGPQIWNQATYGFSYQLLGSAAPGDGASGDRVPVTVYYTYELDKPSSQSVS